MNLALRVGRYPQDPPTRPTPHFRVAAPAKRSLDRLRKRADGAQLHSGHSRTFTAILFPALTCPLLSFT
jgi:hypothetical protein